MFDSMNRTEKAIALVTAPQITPLYFFIALLAKELPSNLMVLGIAFVFATLIQLVSLVIYSKRTSADFFLKERSKRHVAFITGFASYFVGLLLLVAVRAPFIVSALMMSYFVNTVVAFAINRFDKVSIHVWAISGPAVAILYQYGIGAFAIIVAIAVLVGVSRIAAKAHTGWQVISAILVSVPLTVGVIYYLAPLII